MSIKNKDENLIAKIISNKIYLKTDVLKYILEIMYKKNLYQIWNFFIIKLILKNVHKKILYPIKVKFQNHPAWVRNTFLGF